MRQHQTDSKDLLHKAAPALQRNKCPVGTLDTVYQTHWSELHNNQSRKQLNYVRRGTPHRHHSFHTP